MGCSSSPDQSRSFYFTSAIAVAGTTIPVPDPGLLGNIFSSLSVINDTDQDIKITYSTSAGFTGEFIVPKSIKGFTRTLKEANFDITTIKAWSLHASNAAVGNTSFNFQS
jgi:hypothetical protein